MKPALALFAFLIASACASTTYFVEDEELARFLAAGPVIPEVDHDALIQSLPAPGPYRLVPGDVIEIRGPGVLFEQAPGEANALATMGTHLARVDDEGKIQVPLAGEVGAAGRTLLELETEIADAVHPKYLTHRPSIVARVEEHRTFTVSVMGAVEKPGLIRLHSDQLSLFGALSEAGGILKASNLIVGARKIHVHRPNHDGEPETVMLPVKGLNVPYSDVPLEGGERIEVERYEPDTFTVVGLVRKPGAFDYPPEVQYNLMQALATAGGVDTLANPPFATVFRRDADGAIVPATFRIRGNGLVQSSAIVIKPGDVIAVQHTAGSWTRSFVSEVFRIQIGFFARDQTL